MQACEQWPHGRTVEPAGATELDRHILMKRRARNALKTFLYFQLALERVQFSMPLGDEAHLVSTPTPIRGTQQAHHLQIPDISRYFLKGSFPSVMLSMNVTSLHVTSVTHAYSLLFILDTILTENILHIAYKLSTSLILRHTEEAV